MRSTIVCTITTSLSRRRAGSSGCPELSEQLALNVPFVGQLASDPRLPPHLRPIAGVVLHAVRDVAIRLDHPVELPEDTLE